MSCGRYPTANCIQVIHIDENVDMTTIGGALLGFGDLYAMEVTCAINRRAVVHRHYNGLFVEHLAI